MEGIIYLLIQICIVVLVVYLIFWVVGQIGIALPPQVVNIIWVIVALLVILWIVQALPGLGIRMPR